jgi:hypothetical protein
MVLQAAGKEGNLGKGEILSKVHRDSVGDPLHRMVTIINNSELYISKSLRVSFKHFHHKII